MRRNGWWKRDVGGMAARREMWGERGENRRGGRVGRGEMVLFRAGRGMDGRLVLREEVWCWREWRFTCVLIYPCEEYSTSEIRPRCEARIRCLWI